MKSFIVRTILFFCGISGVSAQFSDDFEDGNLNQNPTWTGENTKFEVRNNRLMLNDTTQSGAAFLTTNSLVTNNLDIQASVFMDFNPSSANYLDIFLLADAANPNEVNNGLVLRIGTTQDNLTLRKITNGSSETLLSSPDKILDKDSVAMTFKISYRNNELQLLVDTQITGSFNISETISFTEQLSAGYFTLHPKYTSTRSNKFYFDDISVAGNLEQTPPRIIHAETSSLSSVLLQFSEEIKTPNASSFQINQVNPTGVNHNANEVELTWQIPFENNSNLPLHISEIKDLAGNMMQDTNVNLSFFVGESILEGEVVFTEIHFDPTPVVGLPNTEYVEIYNNSDKTFSLDSLTFVNTTSEVAFPTKKLHPYSYAILGNKSDSALFSGLSFVPMPSFPALSNSGDSLTLLSKSGKVIDVVVYQPNWIEDKTKQEGGWSLESINPIANCLGAANFNASVDERGGTPGEQNSIYDANYTGSAITIANVAVQNANTLFLEFEEEQRNLNSENISASISPNIAISSIQVTAAGIEIHLETEVQFSQEYLITVNGIVDCLGNALASNSYTFSRFRTPNIGDLIVSEIMFDPTPIVELPEVEYFEIYNTQPFDIQMNGCSFLDKKLTEDFVIPAKSYAIITSVNGAELYQNQVENLLALDGLSSFFLPNSGGNITITNAEDLEILQQMYLPSWHHLGYATSGGFSLSLRDVNLKCRNTAAAWATSLSATGGTPGKENITEAFNTSNEVFIAKVFLKTPVLTLELNQAVTIENTNFIGFDTEPILLSQTETSISFLLLESLETGKTYRVNLEGKRCEGEEPFQVSYHFSNPVNPIGALKINEILFDPNDPTGEYIELYNASESSVSLNGITLATAENGTSYSIDTSGYILEANAYVLISKDTSLLHATYPEYQAKSYLESAQMPSLGNSGSSLFLRTRELEIIEFLTYDPSWHFGELVNTKGVALERINPLIEANSANNWTSASSVSNYGTPGAKNSQYAPVSFTERLEVNPPFISPNNDGFEDVCAIALSGVGANATVEVLLYDKHAALRKTIVKRHLAQPENQFIWNGEDEDGFRLPRGIYLIVVKINENGSERVLKTTVTVG